MNVRPRTHTLFSQTLVHFYPFGNSPPEDLLGTFPAAADRVDAALLASGDLRSVLYTLWLAENCGGRTGLLRAFTVTAVDNDPHVIARVLVALELALETPPVSKAGDSSSSSSSSSSLVESFRLHCALAFEVLYNFVLDDATYAALKSLLARLCADTASDAAFAASPLATRGGVRFSEPTSRCLAHGVLRAWLAAMDSAGALGRMRAEDVLRLANTDRAMHGMKLAEGETYSIGLGQFLGVCLTSAVEEDARTQAEASTEVLSWIRRGYADAIGLVKPSAASVKRTRANPTFFGDTVTWSWTTHYGSVPFGCFPRAAFLFDEHLRAHLPPHVALKPREGSRILACCLEQLELWFECYARGHIADAIGFQLYLFSGDLFDFCQLAPARHDAPPLRSFDDHARKLRLCEGHPRKFDLVTTTNVIDTVGQLPLLVACTPLLKPKPTSQLRTDAFFVHRVASTMSEFFSSGSPELLELLLGIRPMYSDSTFHCLKGCVPWAVEPLDLSGKNRMMFANTRCETPFFWTPVLAQATPLMMSCSDPDSKLVVALSNLLKACESGASGTAMASRSIATWVTAVLIGSQRIANFSPEEFLAVLHEIVPASDSLFVHEEELRMLLYTMFRVQGDAAAKFRPVSVALPVSANAVRGARPFPNLDMQLIFDTHVHNFNLVHLSENAETRHYSVACYVPKWLSEVKSASLTFRSVIPIPTTTKQVLVKSTMGRAKLADELPVLTTDDFPQATIPSSPLGTLEATEWNASYTVFRIKLSEEANEATTDKISVQKDGPCTAVLMLRDHPPEWSLRLSLGTPFELGKVHVRRRRTIGKLDVVLEREDVPVFQHSVSRCLWPASPLLSVPVDTNNASWLLPYLEQMLGRPDHDVLKNLGGLKPPALTALKVSLRSVFAAHALRFGGKPHWVQILFEESLSIAPAGNASGAPTSALARVPVVTLWVERLLFSLLANTCALDVWATLGPNCVSASVTSEPGVQLITASKTEAALWTEMVDWHLRCWQGDQPCGAFASAAVPDPQQQTLFRRCTLVPLFPPDLNAVRVSDPKELRHLQAAEHECDTCKITGAALRCGKCLSVRYCCRDCQLAAWPRHKPLCSHRKQHSKKT